MATSPGFRFPESLPVELAPVYGTSRVNDPILLYEGRLELEQEAQSFTGNGRVSLHWLPNPCLHFQADVDAPEALIELKSGMLRLPEKAQGAEFRMTQMQLGRGGEGAYWKVSGVVSPMETGQGDALASVLFHLPNFWSYRGGVVRNEKRTSSRAARAVMEGGGWRVTLDGLHGSDRGFLQELKDLGGYGLTHVGNLARADARTFSSSGIGDLSELLFHFLSFCRGIWLAPLLYVGFDADGQRVWEQWSVGNIRRWRSVGSWFNTDSAEGLSRVFPCFCSRWRDRTWGEPLKLALYWYIESNMCAGGLEGSIVLAQAAFELLAWTQLVEQRASLSEEGFQRIPAADKVRLLVSGCGLPMAIPESLSGLGSIARRHKWRDAPQALTEMRNAFVHTTRQKRKTVLKAGIDALYDAWCLSLWYLELVLLRLLEYGGRYSNRLKRDCWRVEAVEPVPWART